MHSYEAKQPFSSIKFSRKTEKRTNLRSQQQQDPKNISRLPVLQQNTTANKPTTRAFQTRNQNEMQHQDIQFTSTSSVDSGDQNTNPVNAIQ